MLTDLVSFVTLLLLSAQPFQFVSANACATQADCEALTSTLMACFAKPTATSTNAIAQYECLCAQPSVFQSVFRSVEIRFSGNCVWISGHISEEDHGLFSNRLGYHDSMRRELMEEVAIDGAKEAAVAVLNDDGTEVGYVHFGVVHVMCVDNEDVAGRRSGILAPEFVPMAEALKDLSGYESWSRLCLEKLDALLSKAAAAGIPVPERTIA